MATPGDFCETGGPGGKGAGADDTACRACIVARPRMVGAGFVAIRRIEHTPPEPRLKEGLA